VRARWFLALLLIGCGSSKEESAESTTQALAGSDCLLVAVDDAGTLPACAAGKSTAAGPGRPFDTLDAGVAPAEMSPQQQAAATAADALSSARNPNSQAAVDQGFAPPPKAGGQP
jgi:hypothetical protein